MEDSQTALTAMADQVLNIAVGMRVAGVALVFGLAEQNHIHLVQIGAHIVVVVAAVAVSVDRLASVQHNTVAVVGIVVGAFGMPPMAVATLESHLGTLVVAIVAAVEAALVHKLFVVVVRHNSNIIHHSFALYTFAESVAVHVAMYFDRDLRANHWRNELAPLFRYLVIRRVGRNSSSIAV